MYQGHLRKIQLTLTDPVDYHLPLGDQLVHLNSMLGRQVQLQFTGKINCIHCDRAIKKSFSQGYCYPCFASLAQCDSCLIKPEKCHFAAGTCREPEWGEAHCFIPHYVYMANTSGLKVGITRETNVPTRWMDQGAIQALPFVKVHNRLHSGLIEVVFKSHIADKTNWRAMLQGKGGPVDMLAARDALLQEAEADLAAALAQLPSDAVELIEADVIDINYPVLEYPVKVSSFNFDKNPDVSGKLMGLKGQYLILDTGVINLRKFAGYEVTINID